MFLTNKSRLSPKQGDISWNLKKCVTSLSETLGCDAEAVTPTASLADDLGADSLAAVELVMALEEAAGISIAEEDAANLKTVGDIMTYLAAHKN